MISQQHIDKMNDCFYLQEIDDDSVKSRMFSRSLGGEVRKWFKGLNANFIHDLHAFHQIFINRWEVKNNPMKIFSKYETIKRSRGESVQDYCTRFNNIYNSLPANMKPPQGIVLLKFPDGVDPDMAY